MSAWQRVPAQVSSHSWLELAGMAAQLSSPLSARDMTRWCSLHFTVRDRYHFITLLDITKVSGRMNHPPGTPHRYALIAARPPP
eukprot:343061-Prymnesium_polylepis.1